MTEHELRRQFKLALGTPNQSPQALIASVMAATDAHKRAPRAESGPPATAGLVALGLAGFVIAVLLSATALHARQAHAPAGPSPAPHPSTIVTVSKSVSLDQALADSPDGLLVPGWLPFASTGPSVVQETLSQAGHASTTVIGYRSHDGRSVTINQSHDPGWAIAAPAPNEAGTIGSDSAIFWDFSAGGSPAAVLLKLPNNTFVDISTAGLSKDELIHVAESLQLMLGASSTGPPAAIEPVVGRTYHDQSGHIVSLVRWDFPDGGRHKITFSWSASAVSSSSDKVEMGQLQDLGRGADGHSMAVSVTNQGWLSLDLTPVGQPSASQLDLVGWETSPNAPWGLADTYDPGLDLVGFMTLDGPRSARIGQNITYRLDWKINEARVNWGGYGGANLELVSFRFVGGTGQLISQGLGQPAIFSFSSPTGTLELTFRVVGQPGLASVSTYIGGTDVCCETNVVQTTVKP